MGSVKIYAEALFSVAKERDKIDSFLQELKNITVLLQNSEELRVFLNHPLVPKTVKKNVIKKSISQNLSQEMTNFLFLLIDKNRQDSLKEIFREYSNHYRKVKQLLYVEVTTVVELRDDEKQILKSKLDGIFNSNTIIDYAVDKSILGGMLITTELKSIDLTLKRDLKVIKEEIFKENMYESSNR